MDSKLSDDFSSSQGSSQSLKRDICDPRGHTLVELSLKLVQISKRVFTPSAEQQHEKKLQSLEKDRDRALARLEQELCEYIAENKLKMENTRATYDSDVANAYTMLERKLNEESIEQKAIDHQNEYIDFLAATGQALSTQSSQVLDLHYEDHLNAVMPLTFSFMGLNKDVKSVSVLMPESPVLYVPNKNEMLVGDGNRIWYRTDPNITIPWSKNVVLIGDRFYLTWPTHICVYDLDLVLEKTITNPETYTEKTMYRDTKGHMYRIKDPETVFPKVVPPGFYDDDPFVTFTSVDRNFATVLTSLEIVYVTKSAPYVYSANGMTFTVSTMAENVCGNHDCMAFSYPQHTEFHKMNVDPGVDKSACPIMFGGKLSTILNLPTTYSYVGPRMKNSTVCLTFSQCDHEGMRTLNYYEVEDDVQ